MSDDKNRRVFSSYDEQLSAWVAGESHHMSTGNGERCCPDFSCCKADLLQPVEVRRAFQRADEKQRHKYLMAFLGGAIAKERPDIRAHITDGSEPEASS